MFTLQILDRGQTLLYSPPGAPVTLGSGDGCDFRLGEGGIEAEHIRLEPTADGLRLVALGKVRVNGAAVERANLQLGDRIEIGRAVLVVGKSVARPAQPEDVLDSARSRASSRATRRAPAKRSRMPFAIVGVAVVVAGVLAFWNRGDSRQVDADLAAIAQQRDKGELDRARSQVAVARREWRGAEDDRLQRLAAEEVKIDAIAAAVVQLEGRVLEPDSGSYAAWITELRRLENAGKPDERVAAYLVRSSLRETLERRPPAPAVFDTGTQPEQQPDAIAQSEPASQHVTLASILEDADRLAGQELFAQAIAGVQNQLGEVQDPDALATLQQRLVELRATAQTAMQSLVAEADARVAVGRHRDAITMLALAEHRFPGSGEFVALSEALRAAEAAAAAATEAAAKVAAVENTVENTVENGGRSTGMPAAIQPQPVSIPANGSSGSVVSTRPTLSALRDQLDRIRNAEAAGAFDDAAAMLRVAVTMARERDTDYADRLEQRAGDAELRAAFHGSVTAALQGGRELVVALQSGGDATLKSTQDSRFVTVSGDRIAWRDISAPGLAALALQVGATGDAAVGAAGMLYAAGDPVLAEKMLADVVRADDAMKPSVFRAVALGRGERVDERGYVLSKNGFVSARAIDLKADIAKIAARMDGVFRNKNATARTQFVTELLAGGPDALEAVAFAFQHDLAEQIAKIETSSLQKQVQRLASQRTELDEVRKHAKDLIFDEAAYFYPYKPPAVSSERFAQYNRVQADVNRRIDAVRRVWRDDRLQVKVPALVRTALERLEWDSRVLQEVGAFDAETLARIEWVRAVPVGKSIGIAEYCLSIQERVELESWQRVEAYNLAVAPELSSNVRELLKITNEYRAMYRHRPLAVVPLICNAAQGHAEEMSRLGYFAHMSPTPGRRTPFDRMKLAGYTYGVSENIALNGSALGAHNAWLGSSGHHRGLLNPRHKEMGIGVDGRNWVENFGGGATYELHPAWLQAEPR